jgi:hypothetical protein
MEKPKINASSNHYGNNQGITLSNPTDGSHMVVKCSLLLSVLFQIKSAKTNAQQHNLQTFSQITWLEQTVPNKHLLNRKTKYS